MSGCEYDIMSGFESILYGKWWECLVSFQNNLNDSNLIITLISYLYLISSEFE